MRPCTCVDGWVRKFVNVNVCVCANASCPFAWAGPWGAHLQQSIRALLALLRLPLCKSAVRTSMEMCACVPLAASMLGYSAPCTSRSTALRFALCGGCECNMMMDEQAEFHVPHAHGKHAHMNRHACTHSKAYMHAHTHAHPCEGAWEGATDCCVVRPMPPGRFCASGSGSSSRLTRALPTVWGRCWCCCW